MYVVLVPFLHKATKEYATQEGWSRYSVHYIRLITRQTPQKERYDSAIPEGKKYLEVLIQACQN